MGGQSVLSDEQIAQQVKNIERWKWLSERIVVWKLRRLASYSPNNWRPWFNLGWYLRRHYGRWIAKLLPWYRTGNLAAISAYEHSLELCPDDVKPPISKELAGLYCRLGKYKEAIHHAALAASAKPESLDHQINLAVVYFNSRQDVPLAKRILTEALKKQPQVAEDIGYCLRRIALYERGVDARIQT